MWVRVMAPLSPGRADHRGGAGPPATILQGRAQKLNRGVSPQSARSAQREKENSRRAPGGPVVNVPGEFAPTDTKSAVV